MEGPLGAIHLCDACLNRGMNIKHVLSSINIDDIDIIVTVHVLKIRAETISQLDRKLI